MALYHFAYTFDVHAFHRDLRVKIVTNNKLDLIQLQYLAKSIVDNASEKLKMVLTNLRYDDEWLDNPDKDESQAYLWYTICLASVLNEAPSLSNNRFTGSHLILEKTLPIAEWTSDQIRELIFGKQLGELLAQEDRVFLSGLSLYGGALSIDAIARILAHLRESAEDFSSKAAEMEHTVAEYVAQNNWQPSAALNSAYSDAIDMLETAIKRKEALYLLRDA